MANNPQKESKESRSSKESNEHLDNATNALIGWNDREADARYGVSMDAPFNWREAIHEPYKAKDIASMNAAALPDVQMQMTRLAFSKDQKVSLTACQFLLSQGGHGPVSKVEHSLDYSRLPSDQLVALLQSKLMNIQKLNPGFDIKKLISAPIQSQIIDIEADDISEMGPEEEGEEIDGQESDD